MKDASLIPKDNVSNIEIFQMHKNISQLDVALSNSLIKQIA